jgi:hypothetical protein
MKTSQIRSFASISASHFAPPGTSWSAKISNTPAISAGRRNSSTKLSH